MLRAHLRRSIENTALVLAVFLCAGYSFSLLARHSWFFDLFSHFTLQYAVGALILTGVFLYVRKWHWAFFLILIFLLNLYEIKTSYSPTTAKFGHTREANLTIAHYNKLFRNQNWDKIYAWFRQHPDIDLLFVQESGVRTISKLMELKDIFPYQYPNSEKERFSDISVLSKTPFDIQRIPIELLPSPRHAVRISLKKDDWRNNVIIYSIHTTTPILPTTHAHRNQTLFYMAHEIAQNTAPYQIFTGDWNITPYSPYFQETLKISGLQYHDNTLFPQTTWPALPLPFFLRIPIDHILYSPDITLISKEIGPSLGSDHHMILAKFYIPES